MTNFPISSNPAENEAIARDVQAIVDADVAALSLQPTAIHQARSPEETAWQDLDKETYDHAASNGFECRVVYAAPLQPVQQPAPVEKYTIAGNGFFGGIVMKIDPCLPPDTVELQGANRVRMNIRTGEVTAAPVPAPVAGQDPILWYDASSGPYEVQGTLPTSQGESQQITILGSTKGPFGRFTTPLTAAPVPAANVQPEIIQGLGRMTDEDAGYVTLQFKDEDSAQDFMRDYSPAVEVTQMPPMRDAQPDSGRDAALAALLSIATYNWDNDGMEEFCDSRGQYFHAQAVRDLFDAHPAASVAQGEGQQAIATKANAGPPPGKQDSDLINYLPLPVFPPALNKKG